MVITDAKTIVIKIGSALLINENGSLKSNWFEGLIADIASLKQKNKKVVIVTSGAVALGRKLLGYPKKHLTLPQKQAAAATGQILLAQAYQEALQAHGLICAQMLLNLEVSDNRKQFINACNTLNCLLKTNAIPVINENDSIATNEIRIGDNDRLAARVAQMAQADLMILLSDIDGLYTANPHKDKTAQHIPLVETLDESIYHLAQDDPNLNLVSSGGMKTKLQAGEITTSSGCGMIIGLGAISHPIRAMMEGHKHTLFKAKTNPTNAKKRWLQHQLSTTGTLMINEGAASALNKQASLLAVGTLSCSGNFDKGDLVEVKSESGEIIARGLVNYAQQDIEKIIGQHSQNIENILGYTNGPNLIHRDNLVLTSES